jgi:hypothetical protein
MRLMARKCGQGKGLEAERDFGGGVEGGGTLGFFFRGKEQFLSR